MKIYFELNWDGVSVPTWVDYTEFVDVTKFNRNVSLDANNDPQKSSILEIEISGDCFNAVKTNLIDSANRYSNFYVIRLLDTECYDQEFYFKIEDKALSWCDNGVCKMNLDLLEYVPLLDCIKRTTIADNTSGEFQEYPSSGTPHPKFRYCDVVKPTFMYGMIVTISNALVIFITTINMAIQSIIGIIVTLANLLGVPWSTPQLGVGFAEDLLGCSKGHPAPFVRTYIDNVCTLCNITADSATAPILFASTISGFDNQYYNMCLATAYTTKGVDMDGGRDYIPTNQPSWTLSKLLSVIKVPFNARWFLWHDSLFFDRKDLIGVRIWGATPTIDLSGSDAENLLGDVCYTYNGEGKAKKLMYNYGTDPSDNIGNEMLRRFRGIYEDTSGNGNYNETIETTVFELGVAACVLDGKDSAYDANIDKALAGALIGSDYGGCLKTQGDTFSLAKLLLYNTTSPIDDARCGGSDYDIYGSVGVDIAAFQDDDANFTPILSADCKNYNYPFSFDPDANDIFGNGFKNLWQFHRIDVPDPAKRTNIDIDFTLQFCCIYNTLDLYQTVLLADATTEAEIYELDFDYDKREIKIKAKLK